MVTPVAVFFGLLLVARRRAEREAADEGRSPHPPT